jgi:hypothetical protein
MVEQAENATKARAVDSALSVGAILMGAAARNPALGPILSLRELLRRAWERPTTQQRETRILEMLLDMSRLYTQATGVVFTVIGEPIGILLLEAIRSADRMRVCGSTECPAPYFIASRRSQRFCCDACSLPAQREYKRRWWNEHGAVWQAKRKKTQRGKKAKGTAKRKPV